MIEMFAKNIYINGIIWRNKMMMINGSQNDTSKQNIPDRVVLELLLAIMIIAFSLLYGFNTLPITDGWGIYYVELLKHGSFPYRDFFYYLPPLNLLIDFVFWKLSFGILLVYRIWRLTERVFLYILLFRFLCRRFDKIHAFIACVFGSIIFTGMCWDLLGDYNQTGIVLGLSFIIFADNFIIANESKKQFLWLFICGILLGLMFLLKQTVFVAFFLPYFVGISIMCFIKKDKSYLKYILSVAAGCLLIIGIACVILLVNGAFFAFIDQVFIDTGGKGSLFDIIIKKPLYLFKDVKLICFVGLFVLAFFYNNYNKWVKENSSFNKQTLLFNVFLGLCVLYLFAEIFEKNGGFLIRNYAFIGIFILPYCFYFLYEYIAQKRGKKLYIPFPLISIFFLMYGGFLCVFNKLIASAIYHGTSLFSSYIAVLHIVLYFFMIFMILYTLLKKEFADFLLWIGSFALFYTFIMNSLKGVIYPWGGLLLLPYFICFVLSRVSNSRYIFYMSRLVLTVVLFLSLSVISQKCINAYSWWSKDDAYIWDKKKTTTIRGLKFARLSKEQNELYEDVCDVIEQNATKNDFIFSYPRAKIFNILTNRYCYKDFVPVCFFDVSGDKAIEKELALLKKNPPDIIIWEHIPGAIEMHEAVFRNGKPLKQREIEMWFNKVKNTDYIPLYFNDANNISVYKKASHSEISAYKYPWIGKGTSEIPYLIQSEQDLRLLSENVLMGYAYEYCYFKQTTDITLSKPFTPIGEYGTGNTFGGVYDGNGYHIKDLQISERDKQNDTKLVANYGLFGQLSGIVMNVIVENARITGECNGIIASHAKTNTQPIIINCYTTGTVTGNRAGGICDNFTGGVVANCFSEAILLDKDEYIELGTISSYNALLRNCYSMNVTNVDSSLKVKSIENKAELIEKLNIGIVTSAEFCELEPDNLCEWKLVDGKIMMEHK